MNKKCILIRELYIYGCKPQKVEQLFSRVAGRSHNILSDARYRFERGVDPTFVDEGVNIMTHLVREICGGEVSELVTAGKIKLTNRQVEYNYSKVKKLSEDFVKVCKNLCDKNKSILESLANLEPKNES